MSNRWYVSVPGDDGEPREMGLNVPDRPVTRAEFRKLCGIFGRAIVDGQNLLRKMREEEQEDNGQ